MGLSFGYQLVLGDQRGIEWNRVRTGRNNERGLKEKGGDIDGK